MKTSFRFIIVLAATALALNLGADEVEEKIPAPGFRPECESAAEFVAQLENGAVRVYPTIIRTPVSTSFSEDSQRQIVDYLNGKEITKAVAEAGPIDPGELSGRGQFDWFQNDLSVIGTAVKKQSIEEPYVLVMEVLFPPQRGSRQAVFGIHCIVLDAAGNNAFSFLLNSHHQPFVDAAMVSEDDSEQSRADLVRKATEVGLEALTAQIASEKEKL